MAGSEDDIPPPPPPSQTPTQQTPHTVSTIKLPILKKGEYDIWAMKMEHYLAHTDYPIWEVIQRGNGPVSVSTDTNGLIKVLPPKTAEEILARERERKARTTLLMALPEDHLAKFHKWTDAKRSGKLSNLEFQSLLSQLEIHGAGISTEDANQKFLRHYCIIPLAHTLWQFVSENTSILMMVNCPQIDHEDLEQLDEFDLEEMVLEMAGSDTKVTSYSKECKESYAKLKKLYDEQREQLGDANIEIQAYTQALKKVEAQLVAHQKNQLWYEEKIRFMKIDVDDKIDVLTYHKKLLAEAVKEKEELKTKLEKWENSSKGLNKLLDSQLSANDKAGFGHDGAKESKVCETITSVSKVKTSNSKTSNDKVEMPKIETVKMSEPIIEEWESDSEDDEIMIKHKEVTKTVKPSFEKIESVNARNETVRQAENPRKNNKNPRGIKRNWNGKDDSKIR
ncbi:hypothetical protein Tco_0759121 [Tanacetum coccineum]